MATTLRFRTAAITGPIPGSPYAWNASTALTPVNGGTATRHITASLAEALGDGVNVIQSNTVAGPTAGVEFGGASPVDFISPPLDADVTISGTISVDVWGSESSMSANCLLGVLLQRIDSTGAVVSEIGRGVAASELGTSATQQTFNISPTSTDMKKGDRIRAVPYADDAGTMGSGFTVNFRCDGSSNGADGDSKFTFTETFGFITSDPAGTQIFPTNTASDVSTASVDREAWTSRGAGVQTDVTNTAAGPTSPIHVTDTAGGAVVDWFTRQLEALTLGGAVLVNSRALESSTAANAVVRCEVAIVDADGSNAVVWAATTAYQELTTSETARQFYVAGADTAVAAGKRLRIRFYIDDASNVNMAAAQTVTLFYAGTSGGGSGDLYLTFTQTLAEGGGATTVDGDFTADAILRRAIAASFTIDAAIFGAAVGSFTADAVLRQAGIGASFTADAVVVRSPVGSLTVDAITKKTIVNARMSATFIPTADGYAVFSFHPNYTSLTTGTYESQSPFQTPLRIGQEANVSGGGRFAIYQSHLGFDTSSIPTDATVLSALLELDGLTDNSAQDFIVEVYAFDYGADPAAGADVRTAAQLGALTLLATLDSADYSSGQNLFDDVAFAANIVKGGTTKIVLASNRNRTQTAPTDGVLEWLALASRFGSGTDPQLFVQWQQGTPFTIDAVIAKWYLLPLDAIIRRTSAASFTVDAVIVDTGSTVQAGFNVDAIIRRTIAPTFTADALIVARTTASFTTDAQIRKGTTAALTANAVIVRTGQSASFTIDAWIYSPRQDPEGPGEPGETPLVSILVDGEDITRDVILSDATFTMLVNGAVGTFRFRVRDDDHQRSFTSGAEVTLDIDGKRKFGGFALQPKRNFAFPVEDTTDPERPSRFHVLEGVDYNILMTKRVLYDHDDPANVELRHWPAGSHDADVIRYVFDNYTDLAADGVTYDGVTHVGSPNPDKPGVIGSGGLRFVDAMREINRMISGVFYLDPYKVLHFVDVDTPDAFFGLSDRPETGEVGYRELEQVENGTGLVNDAMVWGAGQGSNRIAFSRVTDATSISDHRLWQFGEFTTALFRQASVDMRADTIVNGTPQSKRGGKDDQESWTLVSYEKSFALGQKVAIETEVFGKADVVPIRRMTITFPSKRKPKFQMVLSHEIDEPWNLFEFWFPPFPPFGDFDTDTGGGLAPAECVVPVNGGCINTAINMSDRFITTVGPLDGTSTLCGTYIADGVEGDGTRAVFDPGISGIVARPVNPSDFPTCIISSWDMTDVTGNDIIRVGPSSAKDNTTPDVDFLGIIWNNPLDGLGDLTIIKGASQTTYNNITLPDKFFIRQSIDATSHRAKLWAWDDPEPSGWQYEHVLGSPPVRAVASYFAMEFQGDGAAYSHGYILSAGAGTLEVSPSFGDTASTPTGRAWRVDDTYATPWGGADTRDVIRNGSDVAFLFNQHFTIDWDDWFQPPAAGRFETYGQQLMSICFRDVDRDDDVGIWGGDVHITGNIRTSQAAGPPGQDFLPGTHIVRIRQYADFGPVTPPTWPTMTGDASMLPANGGSVVWEGSYEGGDGSALVLVPFDITVQPSNGYLILGLSIEDETSQDLVTSLGPWGGPIAGGPHREIGVTTSDVEMDLDYAMPPMCGSISLCGGDGSYTPPLQNSGGATELPERLSSTLYQLVNAFHPGSTQVFVNGFLQRPGIEYTEDPAAGQITFASPIDVADVVLAIYQANGSPA